MGPEEIREALEHLHQNWYLAQAPIGNWLPDVAAAHQPRVRARLLRRALLDAIELLRPTRPMPFGSREARSYEVLSLRYVEGLDAGEIAEELGVSERQVYRDLRRALGELAQLLCPRTTPPSDISVIEQGVANDAGEEFLREEMSRVVTQPKCLDVAEVASSAVRSVEPLAFRFGVKLECNLADALPSISADEGLLKQALIQALSLAVQSTSGDSVKIKASHEEGEVKLTLWFQANAQSLSDDLLASVRLLAGLQHLGPTVQCGPAQTTTISMSLRVAEPRTVLVIEDNEGAIELYRRYLALSNEWQVVGATDPRISLEMAARLKPSAIILDIMMPRQDGWSVLQTLRTAPATAGIPVIVCSIFADPELSSALGASVHLKKPVSRVQLLKALNECVTP